MSDLQNARIRAERRERLRALALLAPIFADPPTDPQGLAGRLRAAYLPVDEGGCGWSHVVVTPDPPERVFVHAPGEDESYAMLSYDADVKAWVAVEPYDEITDLNDGEGPDSDMHRMMYRSVPELLVEIGLETAVRGDWDVAVLTPEPA